MKNAIYELAIFFIKLSLATSVLSDLLLATWFLHLINYSIHTYIHDHE